MTKRRVESHTPWASSTTLSVNTLVPAENGPAYVTDVSDGSSLQPKSDSSSLQQYFLTNDPAIPSRTVHWKWRPALTAAVSRANVRGMLGSVRSLISRF